MYADMHVHFRDEEQSEKETIKHGLEVARDSGVSVVGDMPNTERPVINEARLLERFYLAGKADVPEVAYGAYIGVTADPEQLKKAVELRGSSMDDYRLPSGEMGRAQLYHRAYQKTGDKCAKHDGGVIERIKIGQRSAHFCPKHQVLK